MKKLLLPAVIALLPYLAHAQSTAPAASATTIVKSVTAYEYCSVKYYQTKDKKLTVTVDYGKEAHVQLIKDTNGNPMLFNSMIDALNHLGLQGWELITLNRATEYDTYFVLKRQL